MPAHSRRTTTSVRLSCQRRRRGNAGIYPMPREAGNRADKARSSYTPTSRPCSVRPEGVLLSIPLSSPLFSSSCDTYYDFGKPFFPLLPAERGSLSEKGLSMQGGSHLPPLPFPGRQSASLEDPSFGRRENECPQPTSQKRARRRRRTIYLWGVGAGAVDGGGGAFPPPPPPLFSVVVFVRCRNIP